MCNMELSLRQYRYEGLSIESTDIRLIIAKRNNLHLVVVVVDNEVLPLTLGTFIYWF